MEQRRDRRSVREAGRLVAPARPPAPVDPVAAMLLGYQASVGNLAVQRLLSGSATVQRFWPFDDEEDSGGGEETVEAEDTGSIPNEGWDGGEYSPDDAGGEATSDNAGGAAEDWIGPGGEWGGESVPGGEAQPDDGSGQDWIGPGGEWGSDGDDGTAENGEFLTGSPEEQWNQAVEDDDLDEALSIVLRTHGFGGKYVYDIWINPNEEHGAQAGGPLGTPQWISVGYDAFRWGYAWCVSVIGHEMEHAKQRAGDLEYHAPKDEPNENLPPDERGRPLEETALREFLAYSWEVLDSPVKLDNDSRYRCCDEAIYAFAYINPSLQAFYFTRKDRVQAVMSTLTVPEAYQKRTKKDTYEPVETP